MDRRAYWVWLQQAFGPGSRKPARLASQYAGGVQEFCQGGPKLWNSRRDLTDREAAALRDFSVSQAEARLEYAQKVGWTVLTPDCEGYPELFSELSFQSAQAPQRVAAVEGSGRAPVLDDVGKRVSPQALQVWKALGRDPMSVASLAEATGLPASVLLGLLTELELEGLAESLPGKRYIRSA